MVQLLFNPIGQNLLQLKTLLPYDPAPPLLGVNTTEMTACIHKGSYIPAVFTITGETPNIHLLGNRCIKRGIFIHQNATTHSNMGK